MMRKHLLAAAACLLLSLPAIAADLPKAAPAEVGVGRLDRITQMFKADTDAKRIPGAVIMIARNGKVVYHEAFGVQDPATGKPMQKDSIFRMYSMTKPITGVAVLMLMEEGKIRLTDPISKYLPALKSPKVMVESVDAQGRRVEQDGRTGPHVCEMRRAAFLVAVLPVLEGGNVALYSGDVDGRPHALGAPVVGPVLALAEPEDDRLFDGRHGWHEGQVGLKIAEQVLGIRLVRHSRLQC
jgi:hypothetical protein